MVQKSSEFASIMTSHFVRTLSISAENSFLLAVVVGLWSEWSVRLEKRVVIGIVVN